MQSTHAVIYLLYTFSCLTSSLYPSINVSWNKTKKNNKNVTRKSSATATYNSLCFTEYLSEMDSCILYLQMHRDSKSVTTFQSLGFLLIVRPMVSLEIVSQFYARWMDILATYMYVLQWSSDKNSVLYRCSSFLFCN